MGTAGARTNTVAGVLFPDAEVRWRMIVEHAFDGMLLTATDGRILAANPAACTLLGRTEAEICAAGRADVVVLDGAAERFLEERRQQGHARGTLTMRRRDGTTFHVEVTSKVFSEDGLGALTSMSLRDVTEVERGRRALEVLAEAGLRLGSSLDPRETLEHLTSLVVPRLADVCAVDRLGPDGVTRVALATRDPARRAAFEQIRRREIRPDATAGVDFVLRTGRPSCIWHLSEEWLASATLDRAHFQAARALGVRSFVSVPLSAGDVTLGALTLMSDGGVPLFTEADLPLVRALGERAALAIDNATRHAEALQARRLRDEILHVVVHDLRAPLNVIRIAAATLARRSPGRETETIERAVRQAGGLIADLMLASRTESGVIPLQREPSEVGEILQEVYGLNAPLAEDRELELVVFVDPEIPELNLDAARIVQMLNNLVGNAIKFTPPGGRVEVAARCARRRLRLVVSDTGCGIAEADLPRIFDRYWQGAHTRHVGAGLGLSIARSIANAHGGDISVESAVGRGTTFTIELPGGPVEESARGVGPTAPEQFQISGK